MEALRRDIGALEKELGAELRGLRALIAEQQKNTRERFAMSEAQRVEQKADTERNVLAALTALTKQIDLLSASTAAEATALRRDIDGLRERINTVDSRIGGP
jgi:hypothetical protein